MIRFKTLQNVTLTAIAMVLAFLLFSAFPNNDHSNNSSSGGKASSRAQSVLRWTAMTSRMPLPPGSVQGGYATVPNSEPTLLYVCRAKLLGAVWPGKAFAGGCNVGWDGREFVLTSYEILVGHGTQWGAPAPGFAGALVAGTGPREENAYVCRVEFQNYGLHVGRAVGDTCNIGWGGKEYAMPQPFEVLYPPGVSPPRATADTTSPQNTHPNPIETSKTAYRVACGGQGAGLFSPDNYFAGGVVSRTSNRISTDGVPAPPPYEVYQSERYGNFAYYFPDLKPKAPYQVRLHFAEIYFNTGAVGSRVFNVFINSREVLHHFDILAATGVRDRAIVETFTANPDDFGKIVIRFETVANNAKCSAIEVLEMDTAQATPVASVRSAGNPLSVRNPPPEVAAWKPTAATSTALVVQGNRAWTATGVFLNVGDSLKIFASGSVSMGAGWPPMSPVGRPPDCYAANRVPRTQDLKSRYPADQLPCWSLIGRIGDAGPIFYVGSVRSVLAQSSGELWLGVNDDQLGDNSGAWRATITLQPGPEAGRRAAVAR